MGESETPRNPRLTDDDFDAGANDGEGSEGLVSGDGLPAWAFSLSRREKLRRGGFTALIILLVAFLLLGGPGAVFTRLSGAFHVNYVPWADLQAPATSKPPERPSLSLGQVRLPPGTARTSSLHVGPSNTPDGSAYACWVNSDAQVHGGGIGALHFAALSNTTGQWRSQSPPSRDGNSCYVTADTTAPNRVLLAIWQTAAAAINCGLPALYVSVNNGQTWRAAPWPSSSLSACLYAISFVQGQIYALADAPLLPVSQLRGKAPGHFVVTGDLGGSWRAVDGSFTDLTTLYIVGIRPGGHLLVQKAATDGGQSSSLFESGDNGATWRSLGPIPGVASQVYASSDPNDTRQGGFGRLYLIGRRPTGSGADGLSVPYFATAYAGSAWTTIAAPPISLAPVALDDTPIITADVGPGDSLVLTLATALDGSGSSSASPALWSWDPSATTWTREPYDIPLNSALQGHSWSNGHMTAWLLITSSGAPQVAEIQTYVLPVVPAGS